MSDIEKRLAAIEARNKKVEGDKAWETSWTRRISIAILTYIVIVIYLSVIHNDAAFINALVPVVGFLLSTLVVGRIRELYEKKRKTSVK